MESTKPFPETIRLLLDLQGLSVRELGRRMQATEHSRSQTTLNRVVRGEIALTLEHMEGIASALNILPETFAEYRLAMARLSYDPTVIGWTKAMANLAAKERLEERDGDPGEPLEA